MVEDARVGIRDRATETVNASLIRRGVVSLPALVFVANVSGTFPDIFGNCPCLLRLTGPCERTPAAIPRNALHRSDCSSGDDNPALLSRLQGQPLHQFLL
jgi:hypothetical protein